MHNEKLTERVFTTTRCKVFQINNQQISINVYSLFCVLLVIVVFFLGKTENFILSLVVIIGFATYILRPIYLIGPIFLMTIFDDYLIAFAGQSFGRYCVIFFCVGALLKILVHQHQIKHVNDIFIIIIMLFLGIILSCISAYGYTSFPISYVLNIIMLFSMIVFIPQGSIGLTKQLYNYSILGIIFILVLIIKNGIHIILGTRLTIDQDVNPNQLAMGIAQMAAVVIAHLINNKKRIIDYFLIIILISILFLTGSRSGIIAVLLCFIMVYIIAIRKTVSRKKKVRNIVGIILLCGIVYFIYFYLKERISFLMYRFTYENIIATHGTSRMDVWIAILAKALPGHYLFGIGFDPLNAYSAVKTINGIGHGSHNLIVEILAKSGIMGMIIFLTFFIRLFRKIAQNLRQHSELFMPFAMIITIIINGIGEDVLTGRFLWYGAGLVYMILNSSQKEVVQIGKNSTIR